jgi:hypothetical protein
MAWPFSHVAAPNFDSGIVSVPTVATTVDSTALWLLGAHFNNPTTEDIKVSLTDNSNAKLIDEQFMAADGILSLNFPFMPCSGLKWSASAAGVNGKLWGYK